MPIRSAVLGAEPTPESPTEETPSTSAEAPKRRGRRKKAELIADAVIPGDRDQVEVKFEATGNKGQRDWLTAVELYREKKIEFVDGMLKYAVEKMDQQREQGLPREGEVPGSADDSDLQLNLQGMEKRWASLQQQLDSSSEPEETSTLAEEAEQVRGKIMEMGGIDPASDEGYARRAQYEGHEVPPEAEVGDEVVIGSRTYRVGHGNVLVQGNKNISESGSDKLIQASRRWQRELGAGADGPWQSTSIAKPAGGVSSSAFESTATGTQTSTGASNEASSATFERVELGQTSDEIMPSVWKIGNGLLDKIGLPDYSSIQVGPITASRMIQDTGERVEVQLRSGKKAKLPKSVIDGFEEIDDVLEYVMGQFRSQAVAFLEAVNPGSTTQTPS